MLLILLAVFTATMGGLPEVSDSECEFQTTSALARTGWLALGGTPESEAMVEHHALAPVRLGADGRTYSWFGVGQAAAALPLYAAGALAARIAPEVEARHARTTHQSFARSEYWAHLFVGWRNPLLSALTAALLVCAARRLGVSPPWAFGAGLSYGLCTYAWAQARSTLSDVQATFCLWAAFCALLVVRERAERGEAPGRAALLALGSALGAALLTRVATAPAVAVLLAAAVPIVWGAGGRGAVASACAPLLLAAALLLALNCARFGDALQTGYGRALTGGTFFSFPPLLGLAGLSVAPGKGLLWFAPAVVLAPWGARRAWRERGRLYPGVLAGMLVALFAPIALATSWHGAWTYGPRYVLPALPFLWVGACLAAERLAARPLGRGAVAALLALGLATSVPAALVDHVAQQDLAMAAARLEWGPAYAQLEPEPHNREEMLFQKIQWDPRFAAPWAHWRIFLHRIAGRGEVFSARELYFIDDDAPLQVAHERERGFRHLAWVDLRQRLGGPAWPGPLLCLALLVPGLRAAGRALPRARRRAPGGT